MRYNERIREIREDHALTQQRVADLLHIGPGFSPDPDIYYRAKNDRVRSLHMQNSDTAIFIQIFPSLPLNSSYPNFTSSRQEPVSSMAQIGGRGIPLKVLFLQVV
mgnify:CR=1 FL=1